MLLPVHSFTFFWCLYSNIWLTLKLPALSVSVLHEPGTGKASWNYEDRFSPCMLVFSKPIILLMAKNVERQMSTRVVNVYTTFGCKGYKSGCVLSSWEWSCITSVMTLVTHWHDKMLLMFSIFCGCLQSYPYQQLHSEESQKYKSSMIYKTSTWY